MQAGFCKSFVADRAFAGRELVAFGGDDGHAVPAKVATAPLAGVADSLRVAVGEMVDVQQTQWGEAIAGGPIEAGDRLTSDASSRAVKAVRQAGATVYTAGIAQTSAAPGDIFMFLLQFGTIDG